MILFYLSGMVPVLGCDLSCDSVAWCIFGAVCLFCFCVIVRVFFDGVCPCAFHVFVFFAILAHMAYVWMCVLCMASISGLFCIIICDLVSVLRRSLFVIL